MNRIFTVAMSLALLAGTTAKAAGTGTGTLAAHPESISNSPAAPATSQSMTELLQENRLLKLALARNMEEKEAAADQLNYVQHMHRAINSLQTTALQQKEEDSKAQLSFAYLMHQAIVHLSHSFTAAR